MQNIDIKITSISYSDMFALFICIILYKVSFIFKFSSSLSSTHQFLNTDMNDLCMNDSHSDSNYFSESDDQSEQSNINSFSNFLMKKQLFQKTVSKFREDYSALHLKERDEYVI